MIDSWMIKTIARLLGGDTLRRHRPNPLIGLYRWRYEVAVIAVVVALVYLGQRTDWTVPTAIVAAVVFAVGLWPDARHAVRMRCWSVVVQHRLRTAFYEAGLATWGGRIPAILWTSPRRAEVTALVGCPAGIEVNSLANLRSMLAEASFASDVLVERHPRYPNVAVLRLVCPAHWAREAR